MMLETIDWKREKIGDYRALSAIVARIERSIQEDERIHSLLKEEDEILKKIDLLTKDRNLTIEEAKQEQAMIKMELLDHWDIDEKTYKCDMGSATMRTNKTLEVHDKKSLIDLLYRLECLDSGIRTLDMTYLKKLKDAYMIPDSMAYYDEKTSVVIKEAKE
jgi:hypothetical protein